MAGLGDADMEPKISDMLKQHSSDGTALLFCIELSLVFNVK